MAWRAGDDEPSPEKTVRRAKAALARAEHEIDTLTDLVVAGSITAEAYKPRRTNLLAKIDSLRAASFVDSAAGTGLDKPSLTVYAKFEGGKKEERVSFAKTGTDA